MPTYAGPRAVAANSTGNGSGDSILNFMAATVFSAGATFDDIADCYDDQGVYPNQLNTTNSGLSPSQPITYRAAVGEFPIWTTTGHGANITQPYTVLDGLEFNNNAFQGVQIQSSFVYHYNCIAQFNGANGYNIRDNGVAYSDILYDNCRCNNNVSSGYSLVSVSAGLTYDRLICRNALSYNNTAHGLDWRIEGAYSATHVLNEIEVSNGQFYGNANNGMRVKSVQDIQGGPWNTWWGEGVKIFGNNVYGNGTLTTGSFTSVADAGGGQITFIAAGHGISTYAFISGSSVGAYNGLHLVDSTTVNTFTVTHAFSGTATGTWESGFGDGLRIAGFRDTPTKPGYIYDNTIDDNFVGGGNLQLMGNYGLLIEGNLSTNSKSNIGIDGVGIFIDQACQRNVARKNTMRKCLGHASAEFSGAGLSLWNAGFNRIYLNAIDDCKDGMSLGHALDTNNYLYHNVISLLNNINGSSTGIKDYDNFQVVPANSVFAKMNIIQGADTGISMQNDQTGIDRNCIDNVTTVFGGGLTDHGNNVLADPLMTNPETFDYTLQNGSPCINAGDAAITTTAGAGGIGAVIDVTDPYWFWANSAEGFTQDIYIGLQLVTIVSHDWAAGQITLSSPITWSSGENILFAEVAGDIGTNLEIGKFGYITAPATSPFRDDFTGTDLQPVQNRDGWTLVNDGFYDLFILNNQIAASNGGGGAGDTLLTTPDFGGSKDYVQGEILNFVQNFACHLAIGIVDSNNYVAWYLSGLGATGARLMQRVGGVATDLITYQGAPGDSMRIERDDNVFTLFVNDVQVGTPQTVAGFVPTSVQGINLVANGGGIEWISAYEAGRLTEPSEGGDSDGLSLGLGLDI